MAEKFEYDDCGGEIEPDCAPSPACVAVNPTIILKDHISEYDATGHIRDTPLEDSVKQPVDIETDSQLVSETFPPKQTDDISIEALVKSTEALDIRGKDEKPALPVENDSGDVKSGDVRLIEQIYEQDQDGDTYLHCAIILEMADVALRMIQVAPSHEHLNIYNKRRQTPLHLAVITDQWEVARHLVVCGAQLDLCDYHGNTALHIACTDGKESCLWALTSPIQPYEVTDVPFHRPQQTIPQDCNTRTYSGETCLHLAARHKAANYVTIMNYLINYCCADVNKQDGKSGRTILHMCAEDNDTYLMQFLTSSLVGAKLNINAQTWDDKTAFQLAMSRGHQNVVDILIRSNAETEMYETDHVEDECDDKYERDEDVKARGECNCCT